MWENSLLRCEAWGARGGRLWAVTSSGLPPVSASISGHSQHHPNTGLASPSGQSTDQQPCDHQIQGTVLQNILTRSIKTCLKVKVVAGDWVSPPSCLESLSSSRWEWSRSSILINLLPWVNIPFHSSYSSYNYFLPSRQGSLCVANLHKLLSQEPWNLVQKTRWR